MKQSDMHLLSYLAQIVLELKTFQTNVLHKIKELLSCSKLSPEKCALYEIMWKNMIQSDGTDENMAHAHFVLDS
jgi:hypothetical protein